MPKKSTKKAISTEHIEKIHELALKQVTIKDIASATGLETSQVQEVLTSVFPHLKELKLFKDHKPDVFRSIQKKAAEFILQKIPVASLKDLTYLVAILEDKINLIEGKTTQNIGIGIRIEHLVSEKEKVMGKLRDSGVPEHQLEDKLREALQLPPVSSIPIHDLVPVQRNTLEPEKLVYQAPSDP